MTELLAFAERSPWWTLVYLSIVCLITANLAHAVLGGRK